MSMSRKLLGFHCEQKYIYLEYSPSYNDGQCRVNGGHSDCECSPILTCNYIETEKQNYYTLPFLPSRIHIMNVRHVHQYHCGIMEIVNEDFHAIVPKQVNENIILSFE